MQQNMKNEYSLSGCFPIASWKSLAQVQVGDAEEGEEFM